MISMKTLILLIIAFTLITFGSGVHAEDSTEATGGATETYTVEPTVTVTETPVEEAHEDSVFSNATVIVEATNVTSAEANVESIICNETDAGNNSMGEVFAFMYSNITESGYLTAIGLTEASPEGTIEHPNRSAISIADASVTGENIHVFTTVYAQGTHVNGGGYAVGDESSQGYIQIRTILLPNNFYGMYVTSEIIGGTFGAVYAWVQARSDIFSESPSEAQRQSSMLGSDLDNKGLYIFGHSDAERYYHFKKQALLNCYDGVDDTGFATCQRAVYNMEYLLDINGENQTNFEYKYNLTEVIRIGDLLLSNPN
jgi:hypothetical protein